MATINEFGATVTSFQEYAERIRQRYLDIDDDWNIEPESPDGQAIDIWSEELSNVDEKVVYAFQSIDPLTATREALHRIGAISGITANEATASTATVKFTGTNGVLIPSDTEVLNEDTGTVWTTDNDVTISGGEALVNVTCTTLGAEEADVNELSSIQSAIGGVTSVTNEQAASLGTDEEKDSVYRVRRNLSVAKPGDNQVDSMFSQIADLDGVKKVKIVENYEPVADANGVLPHSMAIFVDGGSNEDIAAAIAAKKNPGCGLNSSNGYANKVQEPTLTPKGKPFTATFFRPEITTIYVEVEIVGPADKDSIKQAVVDYANATLFDTEGLGFDRTGFDIGDVIAAGKLFTPVNSIVGDSGYVVSIKISDDEYDVNYNTVDPGFNGIGVFDTDNISVVESS